MTETSLRDAMRALHTKTAAAGTSGDLKEPEAFARYARLKAYAIVADLEFALKTGPGHAVASIPETSSYAMLKDLGAALGHRVSQIEYTVAGAVNDILRDHGIRTAAGAGFPNVKVRGHGIVALRAAGMLPERQERPKTHAGRAEESRGHGGCREPG